ncbi:16S rRNA (adenine(1518)-N(6)/adenine(1519)-N(6))-dimethyltransferase RsmA [Sulfidibacter corallicola]|uniref:Ribosomal RNA small subunit methyltransferase A n=1 Tax=Sulfidibacter corallicola TaxID=2818388 RepID=A0A8A4TLB5_SULCO|nr:16S rRNA (adenine(1518)-N(6)/adenine(1519)-N(6))-dimethyltransferase RsmA [Sulfidibacter corallicola]QTD49912.1 ribosomal RNA small subunit methyltransferase A [Sulfidibacter corallicola]
MTDPDRTAPRAKKRFGQHFLKDRHIVDRILDALEAEAGEAFLEIGPGPGTLTIPFHARGFPLTAIEYDREMVAYLRGLDFDPPLELIEADFMDVDLDAFFADRPQVKVFSNLPYNVSVPITARLLPYRQQIPLMVMMYQKEVAERIRAQPGTGEYGIISVLVRLFYRIDMHFNVAPGSFQPPPKVQSQVIRMHRLERPLLTVGDIGPLTCLLRTLFGRRRKMVTGVLKKHGGDLKNAGVDWMDRGSLLESFQNLGFDTKVRPENLTPEDYAAWLCRTKEYHERESRD